MKVVYWGKVFKGDKLFSLHFQDFLECRAAYPHQMTLRECSAHVLQSWINDMVGHRITIPEPTGILLPLGESQYFLGFLPVVVDVPEAFVKEWRRE